MDMEAQHQLAEVANADAESLPPPAKPPVSDEQLAQEFAKKAFKGSGGGLWAVRPLAFATGAVIGVAFLGLLSVLTSGIVTFGLASAVVWGTIFGGIAMNKGESIVSTAGSIAGGLTGAVKELTRRIDGMLRASETRVENYVDARLDGKNTAEAKRQAETAGATEVARQQRTVSESAAKEPPQKLVNWKPLLFFALLGALGGAALMAAVFSAAADGGIIGTAFVKVVGVIGLEGIKGIGIGQAATIGGLLGGMMSAVFGINYPYLLGKSMDFFGKALSGELFEGKGKAPAIEPARTPQPAAAQEAVTAQDMAKIEAKLAERAADPKALRLAQRQFEQMRSDNVPTIH